METLGNGGPGPWTQGAMETLGNGGPGPYGDTEQWKSRAVKTRATETRGRNTRGNRTPLAMGIWENGDSGHSDAGR